MSVELPPPPPRVARLPRDSRGYPVPWFVEWARDGEKGPEPAAPGAPGAIPYFQCVSEARRIKATRVGLCWVCGEPMGAHRVFVIGPMCVINRVSSEPPSHRDCAEFAAQACPFLVRPKMRRLPIDDLPDAHKPAGIMIERNPGCVALYETRLYRAFAVGDGWLIRLGAPTRVDWWAKGRPATRAEILASIDSGYPTLRDIALEEGPEALAALEGLRERAMRCVPA